MFSGVVHFNEESNVSKSKQSRLNPGATLSQVTKEIAIITQYLLFI